MSDFEFKTAAAAEIVGGAAKTGDPHVFTIIASVTGVVDEVNDIVEPGAYASTLRKRTPKIIKDHSWADRLGKTISIEEYLPGDPRLPKQTAQGAPWPKEAGALVSKVRLFQSRAGREAAERWREYGPDQQFSIGYVVPPGGSVKGKDGIRRIKSLELYEVSDVLWGANSLCGPMPETKALAIQEAIQRGEDALPDEDPEGSDGEGAPPDGDVLSGDDVLLFGDDEDGDDELTAEELADALAGPDGAPEEYDRKYDTSPVGTPGGRQNWVDKAGGLPPFVRAVAHALERSGHSKQSAIAIAVGTIKRWAAGGGDVTAKTRAKAAATVARWEAMKASKGLDDALDLYGYDPASDMAVKSLTSDRGTARLPGTVEERLDALRGAVREELQGEETEPGRRQWPYITVVGTYLDRVIVSRESYEMDSSEAWEIPYAFHGSAVLLGTPVRVSLVIEATRVGEDPDGDGDWDEAGLTGLADDLDAATLAAKVRLGHAQAESKAGRVLSGGNAERIRSAVQALITVLQGAGVDLDGVVKPKLAPGGAEPLMAKAFDDFPDPAALVAELRAVAGG